MRVSTAMYQQAALDSILRQQADISKTQQQLATGKRILTPADDPIASASLVDINQSIAVYEQFNRNADQAESRLAQEESVLKSVTNALQRARELAVQGSNDTYGSEERNNIAMEVRQILNEVVTLANSTDGNNNYMFSGTLSNTKPFSQVEPGKGIESTFNYHGDQGQRKLQIGPQRTVADSDSGFEVFGKIRLGQIELGPISELNFDNNIPTPGLRNAVFTIDGTNITLDQDFTSGGLDAMAAEIQSQLNALGDSYEVTSERGYMQIKNTDPGSLPVVLSAADGNSVNAGIETTSSIISVFETIDRLAVGLENNSISSSRIGDIDAALTHVIDYQSTIGSRMNSIDRQREVNDEFVFNMTNLKSELEDLDYASAISQMNLQMVGMQAAQQTFTRVQSLSLFNYL